MATKSNRIQFKDMVQGKTIYLVNVIRFNNGTHVHTKIEKVMVMSKPYIKRSVCSYWCHVRGDRGLRDISLLDHGIVPNCYNLYKAFSTLNSAKKYEQEVRRVPAVVEDWHRGADHPEYNNHERFITTRLGIKLKVPSPAIIVNASA